MREEGPAAGGVRRVTGGSGAPLSAFICSGKDSSEHSSCGLTGRWPGVPQGEGVKRPSRRPETALTLHGRRAAPEPGARAASVSPATEGRRCGRTCGASTSRVLSGKHAGEVGLPVDGGPGAVGWTSQEGTLTSKT